MRDLIRHSLLHPLALLALVGLPAYADQSRFANWQELEHELVRKTILREWIPMRDGVRLDAEIYLPEAGTRPIRLS